MMTLEVKAKKSQILRFLTFVKFDMEVLDSTHLNLSVEDTDCDNLTDLLDRYKLEWRLV